MPVGPLEMVAVKVTATPYAVGEPELDKVNVAVPVAPGPVPFEPEGDPVLPAFAREAPPQPDRVRSRQQDNKMTVATARHELSGGFIAQPCRRG